MRAKFALISLALVTSALASSQMSALRVPIDATRSTDDARTRADSAVRIAAQNFAELTQLTRSRKAQYKPTLAQVPFFMPMTVRLTRAGQDLAAPTATRGSAALTLSFDSAGTGAFPSDYQTLLQDVFAAARPTMDIIFGSPSVGGAVHVVNYDAQIGDRQAVAGGYFLPNNGSGQMEIRFPVYTSPEAAAVNFVHTLLLAYLGPDFYQFDAYQEGLVRAATMRIMRTPGVLAAGLDPSLVEAVLDNTYDVNGYYDWYNQPGLEGPTFIAPNLLDVPLPAGGSVGGPYLLKYRMSGSAWLKVLAQYPNFIALLNQRLYAQPSIGSDPDALVTAGQAVLDQISGSPGATIEGLSFSSWAMRQYILHTYTTRGQKLLVEPTPITSGLGGSDFGVFLVETHFFQTTGANNNEILLSGTSYPIFWEGDNTPNRIFPSAQEDRMDIAGAYGAVAPNLPDLNGGQPYRAMIDIPVGDQLQRVYVPAGAIATPSSTTPSNLFGTVIGATGALHVRALLGATEIANMPVTAGAFGANVPNTSFAGNASVVFQVIQTVNSVDSVIYTRRVNKGPGDLAVDLRVGGEATFTPTLPKGISVLGFPVQPYIDLEPKVLGVSASQTLVARYNPSRAAYDLFPEIEAFRLGHGYFVRMPSSATASVVGRLHPGMAVSVALKPGWNLVSLPMLGSLTTFRVEVVHAADFPTTWADAVGTVIGTDFFKFTPGANDAVTGAPETGSFSPVLDSTFQAGSAYFVRVLAPEGATLLFMPGGPVTPTATALTVPRLMSGWKMQVQLLSRDRQVQAVIGQSATATSSFDPREDSGIPPSMGGMQAVVKGAQSFYRDMRRYGTEQTYRIHLEGLKAGQTYTVRLNMAEGGAPYCTLTDLAIGYSRSLRPPGYYTFVANASTRDLSIYVPGALR